MSIIQNTLQFLFFSLPMMNNYAQNCIKVKIVLKQLYLKWFYNLK